MFLVLSKSGEDFTPGAENLQGDVMMAYVEAHEVLKHIRSAERLKDIPVIISTADRTTRGSTGRRCGDKPFFISKAAGRDNMRH